MRKMTFGFGPATTFRNFLKGKQNGLITDSRRPPLSVRPSESRVAEIIPATQGLAQSLCVCVCVCVCVCNARDGTQGHTYAGQVPYL
jgi:hypothetical protein